MSSETAIDNASVAAAVFLSASQSLRLTIYLICRIQCRFGGLCILHVVVLLFFPLSASRSFRIFVAFVSSLFEIYTRTKQQMYAYNCQSERQCMGVSVFNACLGYLFQFILFLFLFLLDAAALFKSFFAVFLSYFYDKFLQEIE